MWVLIKRMHKTLWGKHCCTLLKTTTTHTHTLPVFSIQFKCSTTVVKETWAIVSRLWRFATSSNVYCQLQARLTLTHGYALRTDSGDNASGSVITSMCGLRRFNAYCLDSTTALPWAVSSRAIVLSKSSWQYVKARMLRYSNVRRTAYVGNKC